MLPLRTSPLVLPPKGDPSLDTLWRKVDRTLLRIFLRGPVSGLSLARLGQLEKIRNSVARARKELGAHLTHTLRSPDCSANLLCLHEGLRPTPELWANLMPTLLAALAQHGSLAQGLTWNSDKSLIPHETGWREILGEHQLCITRGGLELASKGQSHGATSLAPSAPLVPLIKDSPFPVLSLMDSNPLALDEAHPDKEGNAVSLGSQSLSIWQGAIGQALDLIDTYLPLWSLELSRALFRIIPVGWDEERHLSASYQHAPGLIYLTLHPKVLTMAEAITHEVQHSKLNLLLWSDPVLNNGRSAWAPSPVRPDLRPLLGVLLAVHAFVPVAALHARMAADHHPSSSTPEFRRRRSQVLGANAKGLELLGELGDWTDLGRSLFESLGALHQELASLAPDFDPKSADLETLG